MVIGDFNNITSQREKKGGRPVSYNEIKNFIDMIARTGPMVGVSLGIIISRVTIEWVKHGF